jgi:hypothetical protein
VQPFCVAVQQIVFECYALRPYWQCASAMPGAASCFGLPPKNGSLHATLFGFLLLTAEENPWFYDSLRPGATKYDGLRRLSRSTTIYGRLRRIATTGSQYMEGEAGQKMCSGT